MTTPFEADPADAAEQASPVAGLETDAAPALPAEADPFDVAEQAASVTGAAPTSDMPLEANPADAAEQAAAVETDEDERR